MVIQNDLWLEKYHPENEGEISSKVKTLTRRLAATVSACVRFRRDHSRKQPTLVSTTFGIFEEVVCESVDCYRESKIRTCRQKKKSEKTVA